MMITTHSFGKEMYRRKCWSTASYYELLRVKARIRAYINALEQNLETLETV